MGVGAGVGGAGVGATNTTHVVARTERRTMFCSWDTTLADNTNTEDSLEPHLIFHWSALGTLVGGLGCLRGPGGFRDLRNPTRPLLGPY